MQSVLEWGLIRFRCLRAKIGFDLESKMWILVFD